MNPTLDSWIEKGEVAWHRFRYTEKMEAGLESFLSFLARELELHVSFERALQYAAEQTPSPLREEVGRILARASKKGMSIEKSWALAAQEWKSPVLSRGVALIVHLARQGATDAGLQGLHRLSEDLRAQQQTQLKRYASALTLYALLFIGVSAIVPALFLAFVTVGSHVLELSITGEQVVFLSLLGFPAMDLVILMVVWVRTPVMLFASSKGEANPFIHSWDLDFFRTEEGKKLARAAAVEGASLLIGGAVVLMAIPHAGVGLTLILLGLGAGPLVVRAGLRELKRESETKRMEELIPDSLVLAAALPSTLSFESRLQELSENSLSPLKEEWARITLRVRKGDSVPLALSELGSGRSSPSLEKTRHLFIRAYESGWSLSVPASSLAHELLGSQSLLEERRAVLGVEKMTLLAAGGVLVPLILGIMLGVVTHLSFAGGGEWGSSASASVESVIPWAVRGYLVAYSLLAGLFVGIMEGKPAQGAGYSLMLIPLAQLVLSMGKWWAGGV